MLKGQSRIRSTLAFFVFARCKKKWQRNRLPGREERAFRLFLTFRRIYELPPPLARILARRLCEPI